MSNLFDRTTLRISIVQKLLYKSYDILKKVSSADRQREEPFLGSSRPPLTVYKAGRQPLACSQLYTYYRISTIYAIIKAILDWKRANVYQIDIITVSGIVVYSGSS